MRSIDRYRKLREKNSQSFKEKQDNTIDNTIDNTNSWDFATTGYIPPKKFPITLIDTEFETEEQRFERFVRQLGRCIISCSLCHRGLKEVKCGNELIDPHRQPSIWYKNIILVKYEPDCRDKNNLFEYLDNIIIECGLNTNDFYRTTLIKCMGDSNCSCPFFDLEWSAVSKCDVKLIVCFDDESTKYFGGDSSIVDKPQKIDEVILFNSQTTNKLKALFRILSNPQTRNRLIS